MKFLKKIPTENTDRTEELLRNGFKILKEPSSLGVTMALAMPISILIMLLTVFYFMMLFPKMINIFDADGFSISFTINLKLLLYVLGIIFYTFLHEMIHALTIPNVFQSKKTYWGLNGCFGFVYSEEEIKKQRFVLISIMPLIILTFVVPLICRIFSFYHWYILLLCVINAGGACVDIFNIILILKQVPSGGTVLSNGMKTLYR